MVAAAGVDQDRQAVAADQPGVSKVGYHVDAFNGVVHLSVQHKAGLRFAVQACMHRLHEATAVCRGVKAGSNQPGLDDSGGIPLPCSLTGIGNRDDCRVSFLTFALNE